MEAKLPTHLLSQGWCYGRGFYSKHVNVRFWPSPSHGFFPTSCKMRNRNYSSQNKKQVKKIHPSRPTNVNSQEIGDEESDSKSLPNKSIPILKDAATDDVNPVAEVKKSNETNSLSLLSQSKSLAIGSEDSDSENLTNKSIPILKDTAVDDVDPVAEVEQSNENSSLSMLSESKSLEIGDEDSDAENLPKKSIPVFKDAAVDDVDPVPDVEQSNESSSLTLLSESRSLSIDTDRKGNLSNVNLQDLIGMIRNAETNIHLLNQARIRALEDLEKILDEKETLQGEINGLELKLAETDARLKVAAHEKIHVEVLEDQLEKLRTELSTRGGTERVIHDTHVIGVNSFSEELYLLRKENMTLKSDLQMLRGGLTEMKETNARVQILEKERSLLESSLRELEAKVADSQEDVSKLSTLRSECRILYERVDDLQKLLDEATKQANQAILVLQENHELRKKVEKLEDSLEEANVYKLSSEKMQHYNDLMQHKLKILDERLEKSDEEIYTYVQLYEDSVKDFRETLNKLKGEGKRKDLDEPANDMPWEFWSRLLLMIDAWLLEKKVLADDAYLLREMVWKRDARFCDAYQSCREKNEDEIISTFLRLISSPKSKALHIIHIAAEMAPVAKVGGLGDVVAGLGKELQKRGHLVEIVLPKYDCINYELIRDLRALDFEVESYFDGRLFRNKIWIGTVEGLPVYFIEPLHPGKFFWRGQYYGEHDDFKRFSFFSRAALELLLQAGKKPDIIHCHDWQTAFVAPLYWDIYAPKGFNSARICFTCHNFEYQGAASASDLASCGLDVSRLNRPDRMQHHSGPDRVNPLKGAIVFSNIVTTVSPTYAQEVQTAEGGKGLHTTLNSHSKKFVGILNGIDPDAWNPATDNLLNAQYSSLDTAGKAENKDALRRYLNLSSAKVKQPLVGCITRLVPQKGVHLIRHALYRTVELGGQFVLLGSSPVPHIQREFEDIAKQFQSHEHAQLILKYDESLAHLIYAASDMFIIPSIFEPCGLTQMIAMRYGSIPIARKTGGLNDSVFDLDDNTIPEQFRNGFTFVTADEQGVSNALERAFYHYKNNTEGWQKLMQKVMGLDFSWKTSAAMYEELYLKSVARAWAARS